MITLLDVAIILGFRIHGPLVTGTCNFDVSSLCQELLGVISLSTKLRGSVVSTHWLSRQLSTSAIDAYEVTLERSAHGFILLYIYIYIYIYIHR